MSTPSAISPSSKGHTPASSAEEALASAFGLSSLATFRGEEVEADDEYMASTSFAGARSGYVFKKGPRGLGYYVDRVHKTSSALAPKDMAQDFISAAQFMGARGGYVFKRDVSGLGYYRDRPLQPPPPLPPPPTPPPPSKTLAAGAQRRSLRDFRFDKRERMFRSFCERSMELGSLNSADVERMIETLELCADADERGARIVQMVEEGLRGAEVEVVGATGRTPRGWWGDGTFGLVRRVTPTLLPDLA